MTEDEARAALRAFAPTERSEEAAIAAAPWEADGDGWLVSGDRFGRRFRLARAPGGLRVVAWHTDGAAVAMFVPATPPLDQP